MVGNLGPVQAILSTLAVVLAGVVVWAAVAKLRNLGRTADDFAELGIARPRLVSRLVPVAELAVAVGLLVAPGWGAVAAFALLAVFTVVLVVAMNSPTPKRCACFGTTSDRPVGPRSIGRNLVLMAMAAAVVPLSSLSWG